MSETFKPIPVRSQADNPSLFAIRCLLDLQLLTIYRFLRGNVNSWQGRVLDVGAGESPWRDLMKGVEYVGADVDSAGEFGMLRNPDIHYYDGIRLPFPDASFDHVLCVEVLEHVPEPAIFFVDLLRVMRPGGSLLMTVPWSARLHHLPHDYSRFTPYRLTALLNAAGFSSVRITERGNDVAVIANKLLVLTIRLIRPRKWFQALWSWPLAIVTLPGTLGFLIAAHAAILLRLGSMEDPLGYGLTAAKS